MTDHIQDSVQNAINAMRKNNPREAFEAIKDLRFDDALSEIFLVFQEMTEGRDTDQLIRLATLPLPKKPEKLVRIIKGNNLPGLLLFFRFSKPNMFAGLLMLNASFQEVIERLES